MTRTPEIMDRVIDIAKNRRKVTRADLQLTQQEIETFVHNAQIALCEFVPDARIGPLFEVKGYIAKKVSKAFKGSIFPSNDIACLLVSIAFDLITEGKREHGKDPLRSDT